MIDKAKIKELKIFALNIRIETIKEIGGLGFGHIGGSMSIVDTLAVLYGAVMRYDPKNPKWEDRDWLVCSKGHAGPAIYATLALRGFFPIEELKTLNMPGTHFPSHCDKNLTTGIDMTTGSLGQGASTALGVALGNKLANRKNKTFLIIGDGESQEGQVWEAALCAAQQKLDNLIAFVDYNRQQLDGYTKDINEMGDMKAKFESFRWFTQEVDGSDVEAIYEAIEKAKVVKGIPSAIILNTVKGKGCSFAEGNSKNHSMVISKSMMEEALAKLKNELDKEMKS